MRLDSNKLYEVGLDSITLKAFGGRYEVFGIDSTFFEAFEYKDPADECVLTYIIKIMGYPREDLTIEELEKEGIREDDLDDNECFEIGSVTCNYIEVCNSYFYPYNFYNICDYNNGDLETMAASITNSKTGKFKKNILNRCNGSIRNVLYIDRIFIEEKYRNIGIGKFVISNINEMLNYTQNLSYPDIQVVYPKPQVRCEDGGLENMKGENTEEYKRKLLKFYKDLGFKHIANTECMIKTK